MCGLPGSEGVTHFFRQRPTRGCEGQRRHVGGAFALAPDATGSPTASTRATGTAWGLADMWNVTTWRDTLIHAHTPHKSSLRVGSLLGTVTLPGHP